ncbi:MAG: hypothetical protein HGB00_06510 [Chlorobiaceae bacterium]|nr:hypothetical protein [Chlorobiaceae bacterium]
MQIWPAVSGFSLSSGSLLGFFDLYSKADKTILEVRGTRLLDLPDMGTDKTHGEHVAGEEGEQIFALGIVRLEGVS